MKKNSNDSAYPTYLANGDPDGMGLTKREYFALHLMAGMMAASDDPDSKSFASGAVHAADTLIAALNAPTEPR